MPLKLERARLLAELGRVLIQRGDDVSVAGQTIAVHATRGILAHGTDGEVIDQLRAMGYTSGNDGDILITGAPEAGLDWIGGCSARSSDPLGHGESREVAPG